MVFYFTATPFLSAIAIQNYEDKLDMPLKKLKHKIVIMLALILLIAAQIAGIIHQRKPEILPIIIVTNLMGTFVVYLGE